MLLTKNLLENLVDNQRLVLPKAPPQQCGIAHFGVGAFHRAHQALYTQQAMEIASSKKWGILGIGIMTFDKKMNQVLNEQDFMYTLVEKSAGGEPMFRIINSICDHVYGVDNQNEAIKKASEENIKIITLTITEGGYNISKDTGEFDYMNPTMQAELKEWRESPKTIFGYLARILRARMQTHGQGLTILSCDNIQHNGHIIQKSLGSFLTKADPQLLNWAKENCSFPNSMVDRITPQTSAHDLEYVKETLKYEDKWPIVCEDFKQWVVEDKFVQGRPQWQKVGVQFVEDVSPYEKMKLRILNGSHQALCYLGYLQGYKYVDEAANDKHICEFVLKYLREEVVGTLDPVQGIDLEQYQKQILIRFSNKNIKDTISRICEFTSDRIPLFNVPSMLDMAKASKPIPLSAMVIASWIAYLSCKDGEGKTINFIDNKREQLLEVMSEVEKDRKVEPFLKQPGMFGMLSQNKEFLENVHRFYGSLLSEGVATTLELVI